MQTETFYVSTPIGCLEVFCGQNAILEIDLGLNNNTSMHSNLNTSYKSMSSYACTVKSQIEGYFMNAVSGFNLNIQVAGTAFQQSVWDVISSIKIGETLTYTDIANLLNSSPRAVGNACRANPVPIIVPCHRVVSKSGIGGFAGEREGNNIDVKQWLLEHERSAVKLRAS